MGEWKRRSVLAMGETIKLRSDCVHLAGTASISAGEDVRCAGRVVTQAMTRRLPSGENDPVLQLLPEPMARAVRRALSGTATASEVAALAGTRLEVISERRDEVRIDPMSKTAPKTAAPDVVIPKPQAPAAAKSAGRERCRRIGIFRAEWRRRSRPMTGGCQGADGAASAADASGGCAAGDDAAVRR